MTWKVPMFKILWDKEDVKNVSEAIQSGMNWAIGPNIEKFEKMIAQYIGTDYSVVFNSGTSALHAVLLAHGIGRAEEVIVPSFTFVATANAVVFVGAKPVFADIDEQTFGLDPDDVNEKITDKTKAIIPVHYGGCPCKIKELREIAEDNNLLLIEDAAESLGSKIGDEKVGAFGDSAILSFCQNKIISTGEGGAVVTSLKDIYEKLKLLRSHGRVESSDYFSSPDFMDYITLGYNFRMPNIVAALGVSQFKKVDKIIEMRRKNAAYLTTRLKDTVKEVKPPDPPKDYFHVYQFYTLRANRRDSLMKHLSDKGVMTKVYFHPVHSTHYYKNALKYDCKLPITEDIASQAITIPLYPTLSTEDMNLVVQEIAQFYE